ncbi:MAG: MBL fold metallo-hydrolase [Gammaproteobacteria bacterium]|nr:MBL fold metallo-hydrolase [Gammaproteobacteria bacterium]
MIVRQLMDRDTCTYTYLLIDPETRQGALIDPVKEWVDRDLELIVELGVELLYVLETHVHADHVTSAGIIRQKTGAKIVYSAAADVKAIDVPIHDGDTLMISDHVIKALATPGHTDGCVSYLIDGAVFTGDALLIRGCGRTDFQQGNPSSLYTSITSKLFSLPEDTIVYPAHDYNGRMSSTIGEEKKWNPRIGQGKSHEAFVALMNNLNLELPKRINEAVPANLGVGIHFDPRRYVHEEFSMADLHKVWQARPANTLIVDSRTPEEYEIGHVPGSRNIPFGTEVQHIDELRKFEKVYLYCRSGRRAQTAFTNLTIVGLNNLVCVGHSGMPHWVLAGYPVEQ